MVRIHFIVTAGGTQEPIDAVRFIGNRSTGRLGVAIAAEAAARGHACCLVRARESAPAPWTLEEQDRIGCRAVEFVTASDLETILRTETRGLADPGAVVMAAAVADYSPDTHPGKIPSDEDELVLRLRKVPKIVDRIKTWKATVLLVKFKLESGRGREELLDVGAASARQSHADLMLLNDSAAVGPESHEAILYRPDLGTAVDLYSKHSIAEAIVSAVEELVAEKRGNK